MRWLSILVVALALVAAGCGGSDGETAASDETTVEETLTDETTIGETATEETGETDAAGILDDEDCLALMSIGMSIGAALAGTTDGIASTDELQELAGKVPEEIKADVETVVPAYVAFLAELEEIGLEAGATPSAEQAQRLQAATAALSTEEVAAASQRLETWSKEHCPG